MVEVAHYRRRALRQPASECISGLRTLFSFARRSRRQSQILFEAGLPGRGAFSLVELLVVIAIIVLLASFAAPALNSVVRGSSLNRAGQMIADQLAFARQEAVTKNRDIQVRIFTSDSVTNGGVSGLQLWQVEEGLSGPTTNSVGRVQKLPVGVVFNPNATVSPLLSISTNGGGVAGSMNIPSLGAVNYTGFRIRANGMLDNAIGTNNFVTLQNSTPPATASVPANFYTIQVNPITGKVINYRP
jgi:uncharacterized protein (TIGR02596 family)